MTFADISVCITCGSHWSNNQREVLFITSGDRLSLGVTIDVPDRRQERLKPARVTKEEACHVSVSRVSS